MKKLGPTFVDEVHDFGLTDAPLVWEPDGTIRGREDLTDEQNAALDEAIAAHNPEKELAPVSVSDKQFYQQASINGWLTQQETIDVIKGTLPPIIEDFVRNRPNDQWFDYELHFTGKVVFSRDDRYLIELWDYHQWPDMNDFWLAASKLQV